MRILDRLQKSDILDEKLSSIALLNKIYEKGLQTIVPQVCVALWLFVSIPVSVSSGERSFSKLGIVKNCRRSTMGQECLSSLIMLSCECDIARINYDDVIELCIIDKKCEWSMSKREGPPNFSEQPWFHLLLLHEIVCNPRPFHRKNCYEKL